jgi:hypothetical protein
MDQIEGSGSLSAPSYPIHSRPSKRGALNYGVFRPQPLLNRVFGPFWTARERTTLGEQNFFC